MRERWPIKRIGDIAAIKPHKSEVRRRVSSDALVSFLPMEDLRITEKYACAARTRKFLDVVGSYTYFAEGDVLLAKITPCFENGKLGIAKGLKNGIGFGSSEFIVLRPDKTITNEWLYYFLSREDFKSEGAQRMGGAVGHQRVPQEFIENYPIPIPPLPEQQRLVSILDEAFAGIATAKASAEKNLQNARALFESYLNNVFTRKDERWTEKPLDTVASILNGFAFKSTDFLAKTGVKCIKITNVGVREFVCETNDYLPDEFATEYGDVSVQKGSIVLALTRTIIAGGLKVAILPDEYDGALLNQRVAAIQTNSELLTAPFLFAYLSTQAVVNYVNERVNTLMQPNLSIKDLRSMPIPVPPLKEQTLICERFSALHTETQRLESIYRRKLAALEELKKSLLHQAFTGEL